MFFAVVVHGAGDSLIGKLYTFIPSLTIQGAENRMQQVNVVQATLFVVHSVISGEHCMFCGPETDSASETC